MIELLGVLGLIWWHFVADFMWQSDWMAQNKSKSHKAMSIHISVYSIPFFLYGWQFALVNAALHYITDMVSSRMTTHFWQKGDRHNFFVVIGADQAIHMTCLVTTFYWLVQ